MRVALTAVLFVSPAPSPSRPPAQPAAPEENHQLHGGIEVDGDVTRSKYAGRGMALKDIPRVSEFVGLPVAGVADVTIDIAIPQRDYRRATGTA